MGNGVEADLLAVANLRTYFHTRSAVLRAVDGVDLSVPRARTLGLVGESGSGKSSVALSVLRLVPSPGRIEAGSSVAFDGRELVTLPENELRRIRGREIGMVFQEPASALDPQLPVGRQLTEVLRAHEKVTRRQAKERAAEMLAAVGIGAVQQRLRAYPHEFSGGMRQRVGIAMALICRPALLIADEPTTALDVTVQAQIIELLGRLRDELSLSILLISHDIAVVSELADEVAVMYGGRIVERGEAQAVLQSPCHPYTSALLKAVPSPERVSERRRLASIPGSVPNPSAWPEGCRFSPRCPSAHERCSEQPTLMGARTHATACWLGLEPVAHGEQQAKECSLWASPWARLVNHGSRKPAPRG